ncbi:Nn.00g022230.m01.CDS01 [Neocucurbitaria sp. VM-36]
MSDFSPSDPSPLLNSPSNVYRTARDKRRVSDPLHSRPRSTVRNDPNTTRKTQQKRQRVSDISQYDIRTVQPPENGARSQPPSTPVRHDTSSSESHQASNEENARERPMDGQGNTRASPCSEQSEKGTPHNSRSRSPTSPKTPRSTHANLCAKFLKDVTENDAGGVIYILCDPKRPELGYKIGSSMRANYLDRIREHRLQCKFTPSVVHESFIEGNQCLRTEKLIQMELEDLCEHWLCNEHKKPNGASELKTHTEWFQVTEELAIATVKKWENFMRNSQPYGWSGKLEPVWRHLLQKRRLNFPAEGTLTYEALREHWTLILTPPTAADYIDTYWNISKDISSRLCARMSSTWLYLNAFFWQMTTLVYGMIMLSICRSTVAFVAFALLLTCATFSVLSRLKLNPPKRRTKKQF